VSDKVSVVLILQRRIFEPPKEVQLPAGMPLPRIGEAIVAPGGSEDDPPYVVEKIEHDPGKKRVLVVAKPSDWSIRA
jgi:hypothetical protein